METTPMDNAKFDALKSDIEKSLKAIEGDGSGMKVTVKKLEEQMDAMKKELHIHQMIEKKVPLFGNEKVARDFLDVCRNAVASSPQVQVMCRKGSPLHIDKADLNTYGTGTGVELVPTATGDVISMLLSQGGIARREATVISGIEGKLVLDKRNGTSSAAFTGSGSTIEDDVAVTPVAPGTASVTVSPSQVVALARVSEKLLYQSAVPLAQFIATDMIEQAGVLEDNCVIKGDASLTYGKITGVNSQSSVIESTVAFGSFDLANVIKLPGLVAEAAQNSPNSKFYMSGAVLSILQAQKASTSGIFYMDPTTGFNKLAGRDIVIWHRMDNTIATNKYPVYFGDFKKALVIGTGRDMSITVDHSRYYDSVQAAFRLVYDFDAQFIQPTALARLKTLVS